MKTISAVFNCGRWIWICPDCGAGNLITPGDEMGFCGERYCYPNKFATKEAVINGVIIRGYDKKKQDKAKRKAYAEKKVYKMGFPKDYNKIEDALRIRLVKHQSWVVGQTVKDLMDEIMTHPKLEYLRKPTEPDKPDKPKVKEEEIILPELSDKILRRIQ